jgi:CheY-like chemotaxis protein/cytochrome c-type biogenesis protein CcmH/NrfG
MDSMEDDFSNCTALVVDGNPNSRSILVAQMRELGLRYVAQSTRTVDARKHLESQRFDFVLCEMHFADESTSGQDLLDDLRRNHLLPFHTVFIMITGEATYTKVAEAAESALDGYLLKPHKAVHLVERLQVARVRKLSLQEIFDAIDAQEFERAAALCLARFESKGLFWLYAARVGAELLLRLERYDDAQALYHAVVAAKTLPWAKLGVARTQVEAGRLTQATTTLEKLIGEDPTFADAYDVMGRAQFELGQFDKALATYKLAATLTPASITRLQNAAMMTFYAGDHAEASRLLDRTTRVGLESKMFDPQTLVLLAFTRLEIEDRRGLQRCQDDFVRLMEKSPDNVRLHRLSNFADMVAALQRQETGVALDAVTSLAAEITHADFDFESAGNLLAVLANMRLRSVHFADADRTVQTLGMRFCSNRSVTELLAACAAAHEPYAERIRNAQTTVLELAEAAVSQSLAGNLTAAVRSLLEHAGTTLNVRLIDNAYQLLLKADTSSAAPTGDLAALKARALELRTLAGAGNRRAALGNQKRQAGGVMLRTTARLAPGQIPTMPAAS